MNRIDDLNQIERTHLNDIVAESKSTPESPQLNDTLSASPAYATQILAPLELRVLSQPKGTKYSIDRYTDYVYRSDVKKETFIYHAEMGINKDHVDFKQRKIEWLYVDYCSAFWIDQRHETESPASGGHSTCSASKAVGNKYGAAKAATLVVVKMPDYSYSSLWQILPTIERHIRQTGRQEKSVVSMSWGSIASFDDLHKYSKTNLWDHMSEEMIKIHTLETVIIASAGNSAEEVRSKGGTRLLSDTFPTILGPDHRYSVLGVGNCDNYGYRVRSSQVPEGGVYAPGVNIKCASDRSANGFWTWSGTSFCELKPALRKFSTPLLEEAGFSLLAAPLVAGVAANIMATERQPPSGTKWDAYNLMVVLLKIAGWKRPYQAEWVVNNMVNAAHNQPTYDSGSHGLSLTGSINTSVGGVVSPSNVSQLSLIYKPGFSNGTGLE